MSALRSEPAFGNIPKQLATRGAPGHLRKCGVTFEFAQKHTEPCGFAGFKKGWSASLDSSAAVSPTICDALPCDSIDCVADRLKKKKAWTLFEHHAPTTLPKRKRKKSRRPPQGCS